MESYLTPNDPDAFLGWIQKENRGNYKATCPQCKGYGGWNLKLNEYPRQPPPHCHFRSACTNCNGVGYVDDDSHIHKWKYIGTFGRCYEQYQCLLCPATMMNDSTD